ncbi:MAG: hypothetical protein ABR949_10210 [Candidatus Aquilonibacter sp.]|jgi:ssDNA-specific exonuclease RecJ
MDYVIHKMRWVVLSTAAIVLIIAIFFGLAFATQSYGRWNVLQDAQNQVQVNDIMIAQTRQLVEVQKQKAQIKVAEAQGIAQAQAIINGTLTPLYLQHEAIEAQLQAAQNSSHTETIYVPSGPQGIPMVFGQTHQSAPK